MVPGILVHLVTPFWLNANFSLRFDGTLTGDYAPTPLETPSRLSELQNQGFPRIELALLGHQLPLSAADR